MATSPTHEPPPWPLTTIREWVRSQFYRTDGPPPIEAFEAVADTEPLLPASHSDGNCLSIHLSDGGLADCLEYAHLAESHRLNVCHLRTDAETVAKRLRRAGFPVVEVSDVYVVLDAPADGLAAAATTADVADTLHAGHIQDATEHRRRSI